MLKNRLNNILNECGVDEAGAGCLFGPVVAASVIMPVDWFNSELNDSKKLSEKKRERLYDIVIQDAVSYSIQEIDNNKIDNINILQARFLAMDKCIKSMSIRPDHVLIDGDKFYKNYDIPFTCVVRGDGEYLSIAAASVLAKVYRDRLVVDISKKFPNYLLEKHKGYGTKVHIDAIKKFGLTELHRKTFCGSFI